jgi:hypothetical protein
MRLARRNGGAHGEQGPDDGASAGDGKHA